VGRVAEPLGLDVVEAAAGILEIANASMVSAIHLVSTQRGFDPREFALVAFGGAGPLHANDLMDELHIPLTLIPRSPGLTSAVGLLLADVEHNYSLTRVQRFSQVDLAALNADLADFAAQGRAALAEDGVPEDRMQLRSALDLRYVGQSYELRIDAAVSDVGSLQLESGALDALLERFHAEHRRTYGHAAPEEPVELVNVRLTAVGRTPRPSVLRLAPHEGSVDTALRTRRPVFFSSCGFVDCPIYDRYQLGAGAGITGPAIIEELDSTVVVHPRYAATVDEAGCLRLIA